MAASWLAKKKKKDKLKEELKGKTIYITQYPYDEEDDECDC